MGVVSINLEMDVEQWYRGIPKKSAQGHEGRSKVINRLLRKYIQAQLGDKTALHVDDLTPSQLIFAAITSKTQEEWCEIEFRRAMLLRETLVDLIE